MSMSGYDKATMDAYNDFIVKRENTKEEILTIANLLSKNVITYEEALKRIETKAKEVNNAKRIYKQEIAKIIVIE